MIPAILNIFFHPPKLAARHVSAQSSEEFAFQVAFLFYNFLAPTGLDPAVPTGGRPSKKRPAACYGRFV